MRRNNNVYTISVIALMLAIMGVLGFTPLATITVGVFNITLLGFPVAIMACLFGPIGGLIGGTAWGFISLTQGLTGMDPSGPILFGYSPVGLIVACLLPRMLTGFLSGLLFDAISIKDKKGYVASAVSSISVPVFNTLFFISTYGFFFYQDVGDATTSTSAFIFIGTTLISIAVNFLVELAFNASIGYASVLAINKIASKMGLNTILPHFWAKKEKEDVDDMINKQLSEEETKGEFVTKH